jgi:biopolymer transport protein ExbD
LKNPHARAALLLVAALLASACKPANVRDLSKESVADKDLKEAAAQSDFTITVTVDAARNLYFRKEKIGTTEDIGPLKERVKQAVERNGKADPEASGNNVVFFCAPADFKYGDVAGVLDAIKDAGGSPVGLTDCDALR